MKYRFLTVFGLTSVLLANVAQAVTLNQVDLNGIWVRDSQSCAEGQPAIKEIVEITDDGDNYHAVKQKGSACTNTGLVSFFGSRTSGICKTIGGTPTAPSSTLNDCTGYIEVTDKNTLSLFAGAIVFKRKAYRSGEVAKMAVSKVECENLSTGDTAAGKVVGTMNKNSQWNCAALPMKKGDEVIQTITGKVN
jgi:hypothetical protein